MTSQEEFEQRIAVLNRYGEDSEEYRVHRRRAQAMENNLEFWAKVGGGVLLATLVLLQVLSGNSGGGRYHGDQYDWTESAP